MSRLTDKAEEAGCSESWIAACLTTMTRYLVQSQCAHLAKQGREKSRAGRKAGQGRKQGREESRAGMKAGQGRTGQPRQGLGRGLQVRCADAKVAKGSAIHQVIRINGLDIA